jgi:hypothetical protein
MLRQAALNKCIFILILIDRANKPLHLTRRAGRSELPVLAASQA